MYIQVHPSNIIVLAILTRVKLLPVETFVCFTAPRVDSIVMKVCWDWNEKGKRKPIS